MFLVFASDDLINANNIKEFCVSLKGIKLYSRTIELRRFRLIEESQISYLLLQGLLSKVSRPDYKIADEEFLKFLQETLLFDTKEWYFEDNKE